MDPDRRAGEAALFWTPAALPDAFALRRATQPLDAPATMPMRLPAATIIGTATPLYTDETGDGRFVWRAATR